MSLVSFENGYLGDWLAKWKYIFQFKWNNKQYHVLLLDIKCNALQNKQTNIFQINKVIHFIV